MEDAIVPIPPALAALAPRLLPLSGLREETVAHFPGARAAAVMILLFERHGEMRFVLTARPESLSSHPGQISLPGGRIETDDASPWDAAAREVEEEVGLPGRDLVPLGRLPSHHLRVSEYLITPCVGWYALEPEWRPDASEVAEIIEIPLAGLIDAANVREGIWRLRGADWHVAYYQFGSHVVWGATARMLHDLAVRLRPLQPGEPVPGSVRPAGESSGGSGSPLP